MSEATTTATPFVSFVMEVNKREKVGNDVKFVKVGEQTVYAPILAHCIPFITSAVKKDDKGNEIFDEGFPIYEDDRANWLQAAILASIKAAARNKMVNGTATLKDGAKIAASWEDLTAEVTRDGAGLKLMHEFRAAFAEWVSKLGLSENAAASLISFVKNKDGLTYQSPVIKGKVAARVEAFAESLSAELAEKFMRPMGAVIEACNSTGADDNF